MLKLILITLYLIAHYADGGEAPEELPSTLSELAEPEDPSDILHNVRGTPFYVSTQLANWYEAYMICRTRTLQLVKFLTQAEWTALQGELVSTYPYMLSDRVWTSGTNLGNRRFWSWFSTGLPIAYSGWANGQPNNFTGNQNCLELNTGTGTWNDAQCSSQKYFICETP